MGSLEGVARLCAAASGALQRGSDDLLDARLAFDVAIVLAATLLALALGAATLRRRTP